jgi:2-oxoacid:acceptor oxidoreductase delta subunit (pyruvate/2-ketoisovalerate family)
MIEPAPREKESFRDPGIRVRDRQPVNRGLDEAAAIREAARCLGQRTCDGCDLCRYFCPDLCITRNRETGEIEIDYHFCKGCGICAAICPKGAISMVREE